MSRLFDAEFIEALRRGPADFTRDMLADAANNYFSANFCAEMLGPGRVLWSRDLVWREMLEADITDTLEDCTEIEDLGFQVGAPPEVYARVEAIRADATAALALLRQ